MAEVTFKVQYTKHITQKRKTWHDGLLVLKNSSAKATLFAAREDEDASS